MPGMHDRTLFHRRGMGRLALSLLLALAIPLLSVRGGDGASGEEADIDFSALAAIFRKHCVRVYINGKRHEGKSPSVGEFAADIRNERPTPVGGYWWDDRHVIVEDPVIQDHFIRSVEIGLPFTDRRYPARVAGRFVKVPALLIEVMPGEEGVPPQAFPLEFADGDAGEAPALSYGWENGDWRIKADMWHGPVTVSDDGSMLMNLGASGVVFSEEGVAFGLAFGDKIAVEEDVGSWNGSEMHSTPLLHRDELDAFVRQTRRRLDEAVLETRFHLRVKIDEDDESNAWTITIDENMAGGTEVKAAGLVVGPRHLFIPFPLEAEGIARIERITVRHPSRGEIEARFAGACREYMAVIVETDEDLPAHGLPYGFAMLNPMVVPEELFQPTPAEEIRPDREYIHRWRVDYSLGRRRETVDYDRWLGAFRGYRGDTVVLTRTNEEEGTLAFDIYGNLCAVALKPRALSANDGEGASPLRANAGFRPIDTLHKALHSDSVFDPSLAPVREEEGRRLIDLGVEYQKLDANTSRLFHAAPETRGGRIGMLVTHVYPDSTAERLGLREHDVLLRLFLEGRAQPVELVADDGAAAPMFDLEDMSAESIQQTMSLMPPPWPNRDNNLSGLLTAAGVGRKAELEYLREGEPHRVPFVTDYASPDYRNAPKHKSEALGLTVKPITYEVRRYFRRADSDGVIVSKAEVGGKGSVAGLHPYLLVTHLDGERIAGLDDFKAKLDAFETGAVPAAELTVEGFGKTRLVKIEQR